MAKNQGTTSYSLQNKSVPKGGNSETCYSSKKAMGKFSNGSQGRAQAYKPESVKLG